MDLLKFKNLTYDNLCEDAKDKKVIAWGFPGMIDEIMNYEGLQKISISYFVDKDERKYGKTYNGLKVFGVDTLRDETQKDKLIVILMSNFSHVREMSEFLESIGIYNFYSLRSLQARFNEKNGILPPFKIINKLSDCKDLADARYFLTKNLKGKGLEVGAGAKPFPLPEGCSIEYADFFSHNEGEFYTSYGSERWEVPIAYRTSLEDLTGVADNSLDFILSSHVIEHCRNPFKAFESCHKKLKPNGTAVFIVPDMRSFSDKDRELTTIQHFDEDYQNPSEARDLLHAAEAYIQIYKIEGATLYDRLKNFQNAPHDLHYHTFTYESFGEVMQYFSDKYNQFSDIKSYQPLSVLNFLEFYYILVK